MVDQIDLTNNPYDINQYPYSRPEILTPEILINFMPPEILFALDCTLAVNPDLTPEQRKKALLNAGVALDNMAVARAFPHERDPMKLFELIFDPKTEAVKRKILDEYRTPQAGKEEKFDQTLAAAVDRLFPSTTLTATATRLK